MSFEGRKLLDSMLGGWKRISLPLLVVIIAVGYNLYGFHPQLSIEEISVNDSVYHFAASKRMAEIMGRGENFLDAWVGDFSLGYPLWHSYQPLPHFVTAALMRLAPPARAKKVYAWLLYLLLAGLPIAFYVGGRALGLRPLGAGLAAGLAAVTSAAGNLAGWGIGPGAFNWAGSGLYTQLWGVWGLFFALAAFRPAVDEGRGCARAGLGLAAAGLCHIVFGYAAFLSAGFVTLVGSRSFDELRLRMVRMAMVFTVGLLVLSFFLVPLLLDRNYVCRSRWEHTWKWDSLGGATILGQLVAGRLLDGEGIPLITVLAGLGLLLALLRSRREARARCLPTLALLWLILYFGRPTWGHLLKLFLVPGEMHLHRFQPIFQAFAVLLAGLGLASAIRWFAPWRSASRQALVGIALCGLFFGLFTRRVIIDERNAQWGARNRRAWQRQMGPAGTVLDRLIARQAKAPGRVHAGKPVSYGKAMRIGETPFYMRLAEAGLPSTSFLFHSMSTASDTMVLLDERQLADYRLFGVRWVVAPEGVETARGLLPRGRFGPFRLFEVPQGGYFDLIRIPFAFEGTRETHFETSRDWLRSGIRHVKHHVALFIDGPAPSGRFARVLRRWQPIPKLGPQAHPPRGSVTGEGQDGARYHARVRAHSACHVLFRASYHPGLVARVDGRPVATMMVTPGFLAFPIPKGEHFVEVLYEAGSMKAFLLFLGLLGTLAMVLLERRGWVRVAEDASTRALRGLVKWWRRVPGPLRRPTEDLLRRNGLALLAVVLFAILAMRPCFRGQFMDGHDALEYPPRQVEFHENLRHGILRPLWAPDLSSGHGQPLFLFAPPLFYWMAEIPYCLGAGLADSIGFAAALLGLLGGLAAYGLALNLMGSRRAGVVTAVAFLFVPYLHLDIYVRGNYMEFAGLCLLPACLWALLAVARPRPTAMAFLAAVVTVAFVLLSHNAVALVALPALGAVAAAAAWPDRRALSAVAGAMVLGLALSAWFWLPALVEKQHAHMDRLLRGHLHYGNHFVAPSQLLRSPWGYGCSVPGEGDGMSFALGPIHILFAVMGLGLALRQRGVFSREGRIALALATVAFVAAVMSTDLCKAIWDRLPLLQYLQFPWRLHCVPALALSVLSGFLFLPSTRRRGGKGTILVRALPFLAVLLLFAWNLPHGQPRRFLTFDDPYYAPKNIARLGLTTTTCEEYEPRTVKKLPPRQGSVIETTTIGVSLKKTVLTRMPDLLVAKVSSSAPCTLRLSIAWFPGWTVRVGAKIVKAIPEPIFGRISFPFPGGTHHVIARLENTAVRDVGGWISLGAFLLVILLVAPGAKWLWRTLRG